MLSKYCPDCGRKMDASIERKMFCAACRRQFTKKPTSDRFKQTREVLNSPEWDRFREYVLHRDGFACQTHFRSGVVKTSQSHAIDHIIPRHVRPELTFVRTNVETLCKSCHNAKTFWEEHGRMVHWDYGPDRWVCYGGTPKQLQAFAELAKITEIVVWPGINLNNVPTRLIVHAPNARDAFIVAQRIAARPLGFV